MKSLLKLSILPLTLILASCNEKISPELQNASSTTSGDITAPPSEYYFRLVNTAPTILNQKLHRTGSGHYNTACSISSGSVAMHADYYQTEAAAGLTHDQKTLDITCYLEAEELGMQYNGLQFQIEASANTCDYIGYQPFSYYDRIPGDSTASYLKLECDTAAETQGQAAIAAYMATQNTNAQDNAGYIGCGEFTDTSIALAANRTARTIQDGLDDLCDFNYTDVNGPNCDTGVINIQTISLGYDTTLAAFTIRNTPSVHRCGGKVANCIRGPITQAMSGSTGGTVIASTTQGEAYATEIKLSPLKSGSTFYNGTYEYSNFRRNLASLELDFADNTDPTYDTIFTTSGDKKDFNPDVMEYYAANLRPQSATPILSQAEIDAAGVINGWTAKPLAADPFMGIGSTNRTNPFYTFICYDNAFDKKAQIRMVVRDWDRNFAVTTALENISDYLNIFPVVNTTSRMDNPRDFEVPGSPQSNNQFNDKSEFDDLVQMERTAGAFTAGISVWRPLSTVVVPFPDGFFNSANFTNGNY